VSAVRKAVLLTHGHPEGLAGAIAGAVEAAGRAGCEIYADAEEHEKHGAAATEGIADASTLSGEPDLCLALGGDGTILKGLRRFSGTSVPVFGINYGTVGFLAAVESQDLDRGLDAAFSGDFEVIDLPALEAALPDGPGAGLNDISFTRRPHHRVAELSYRLGGREVGHVRCDGLVAATPVGSTGYNLANGGPILAWGVEGYVVSFVSPHTLTSRPLVVAPDDILHVHNDGTIDSVDVAIDGVQAGELGPDSALEVRFRDGRGRLAQLEGGTFYNRIREKFGRLTQ
jgi:NAD+ kinase